MLALPPALLLALPASSQADQRSRLESVRREIEQREARAADYREEADGLLEELDGIDRERSELRRSMRRLRRHARNAEQDLAEARVRTAVAAKRMDASRARLEARLVSLYKFSSLGGVRVLYSARDFQSFARSRQGLTRILEQDRRFFAGFRESQIAWQRQRDLGLELLEELSGSGQELARREDLMRQTTVERRNAIALLRSRSGDELRAARELRDAAERLERAIERMPRSGAGFSGFRAPGGGSHVAGRRPPSDFPSDVNRILNSGPKHSVPASKSSPSSESQSALLRAAGYSSQVGFVASGSW